MAEAFGNSNKRREALKRKAKLMTKIARTISLAKESEKPQVDKLTTGHSSGESIAMNTTEGPREDIIEQSLSLDSVQTHSNEELLNQLDEVHNKQPQTATSVTGSLSTITTLKPSSTLSVIEGLVLVLICGFSEGVMRSNQARSMNAENKGISNESFMVLLHEVHKLDLIKLLLSKTKQHLNYNKTLLHHKIPVSSPDKSETYCSVMSVEFPQCLLDAKSSLISKGLIEDCCGSNDFVNMDGNEVSKYEFERYMNNSSSLTGSVIESFMNNFEEAYYQSVRNIDKDYDIKSSNKWYDYKQYLIGHASATSNDNINEADLQKGVKTNRVRLTEKGYGAFYFMTSTPNSLSEFVLSNLLISPSYHISSTASPAYNHTAPVSKRRASSFDYASLFSLQDVKQTAGSRHGPRGDSLRRGYELIGCLSLWYDMNSLQYVISPKQAHIIKYPELLNEMLIKKKILKTFVNISKSIPKKDRIKEEKNVLKSMDTIIDVSRRVLPARRCLLSFHSIIHEPLQDILPSKTTALLSSDLNQLQLNAKVIVLSNVYGDGDEECLFDTTWNPCQANRVSSGQISQSVKVSKDAIGLKTQFSLPFISLYQAASHSEDASNGNFARSSRLVSMVQKLVDRSVLQLSDLSRHKIPGNNDSNFDRLVVNSKFISHYGDTSGCRKFHMPCTMSGSELPTTADTEGNRDVSQPSSRINSFITRPNFFLCLLEESLGYTEGSEDDINSHGTSAFSDEAATEEEEEEDGSDSDTDGDYLDSDSDNDSTDVDIDSTNADVDGSNFDVNNMDRHIKKLLNPYNDSKEEILCLPLHQEDDKRQDGRKHVLEYALHLSSYGAVLSPSITSFLAPTKLLPSISVSSTITSQSEDHDLTKQCEESIPLTSLCQEDGTLFKLITSFGELAIQRRLLSDMQANVQLTKHKVVYSCDVIRSRSIQQSSSSLFSSKQYLLKMLNDYKHEFHEFKQSSWIYSFYIFNYKNMGCLPGLAVPRPWLSSFDAEKNNHQDAASVAWLSIFSPTVLLKYFIFTVLIAVVALFVSDIIIYMVMFILTAIYEIPILKIVISLLRSGSVASSNMFRFSFHPSSWLLFALALFGPLSMLVILLFGSTFTYCVLNLSWTLLGIISASFYLLLNIRSASASSPSSAKSQVASSSGGSSQNSFGHMRVRGDLCVGDYIKADQAAVMVTNLCDEYDSLEQSCHILSRRLNSLLTGELKQRTEEPPISCEQLLKERIVRSLKDHKSSIDAMKTNVDSLSRWSQVLTQNTMIYQNNQFLHSNNRDENVIFMLLTLFISYGSYLGTLFGFIIRTYFFLHHSPDVLLRLLGSAIYHISCVGVHYVWYLLFEKIPALFGRSTNKTTTTSKGKHHAVAEVFQLMFEVAKPFVIRFWQQHKPSSLILISLIVVGVAILVRFFA